MYKNPKPIVERPKRIDLYFEESGQDTRGRFFIVAGVAVDKIDEFRKLCESYERISGKRKKKWSKAHKDKRLAYLRSAISGAASLKVTLFYSVFYETTDYDEATIKGIAKTLRRLSPFNFRAYVYVDGLGKAKCRSYKTNLRKLGYPVEKVSGIRKDENEPLIRLADAVAGAAGHLEKHQSDAEEIDRLFSQAKERGTLVKL